MVRQSSAKALFGGSIPPYASNVIDYFIKKGWVRNPNHAIWFFCSVYFFIFTILSFFGRFGKIILILPIIFHMSAVTGAIVTIYIKKEKSEVYSKDCIWYNSLMTLMYGILMYAI